MSTITPSSGNHGSSWLRREAVIERFEAAWRETGSADVAAFLPPPGTPERILLLLPLAQVDLEYRWDKGERVLAESYVERFPELADAGGPPLELIATELEVRVQLGCAPEPDELKTRFPERAEALLPLIASVRAVADTGQGSTVRPGHESALRTSLARSEAFELAPEVLRRLGRYELRAIVGRGSFATVYRAWDPVLRRDVAVKVPHPHLLDDPMACDRLLREARSAARLRHPALVPLIELGEAEGRPFLVYEYIAGPTLAQQLRQATPTPDEAAAWVLRLAEALDYAHQAGIVHRDVKPSNVMMDPDGKPLLSDFGLALQLDAHTALTREGDLLGTPCYMAPEQAAGRQAEVGPQSDVYSLGVLLYELLSGCPPFAGSMASILQQVIHQEPQAPRHHRATIPADLEVICLAAMAKERRRRYRSAAALADDLRRYLKRLPIRARRTGPLGRAVLWCRRKPALATTLAAAVLAVLTISVVSYRQVLEERDRFRSERDHAQENLYLSLVSDAQAQVRSRDTGWWWKALDDIREASALPVKNRDATLLRELAIQCMGSQYSCFRLRSEWPGHAGGVVSVAWSPDGSLVATAARDETIRIWDPRSDLALAVVTGTDGTARGLAFHPSRPLLVAGCPDGQVRIFENQVFLPQATPPAPTLRLDLGGGAIRAITLSPDGGWLAAGCADGSVRILPFPESLESTPGLVLARMRVCRGHTSGPVYCLAFSPDGKQVVSGADDRTIRFWDVFSGTSRATWTAGLATSIGWSGNGGGYDIVAATDAEGYSFWARYIGQGAQQARAQLHAGTIHQLLFHARNQVLAASADGTMRLWELWKWEEMAIAQGNLPEVLSATFDPAHRLVLAGYADGKVRLWELTEPPQRELLGGCQNADFLGPEPRLADDRIIADLSHGFPSKQTLYTSQGVTGLVVHPDGRRFAFTREPGVVEVWDRPGQRELVKWKAADGPITVFTSDPAGKLLATAFGEDVALWDWETGRRVRTLRPNLGPIEHLAWFHGGNRLVVSARDGTGLLRPDGGEETPRPLARVPSRSPLACGPDAVAYPTGANLIEVLEPDSGEVQQTLRGHTGQVTALAFSTEDRWLATASRDGTIRLWNRRTGREEAVYRYPSSSPEWLRFDPRGQYLLSGGAWPAPSVFWALPPQSGSAVIDVLGGLTASPLPDGTGALLGNERGAISFFAAADLAKAIRAVGANAEPVHVVEPGVPVVLGGHIERIWGVAASPDGMRFATAAHDKCVKLWDARTGRLVHSLAGHTDVVWCVAFSADSRFLASGGAEVKVWDVATGRPLQEFQDHTQLITAVAFHPSGHWLASAGLDGLIRVRELPSGQDVGLLHRFDAPVHGLAFRPDGRWLAAACDRHLLALWPVGEAPPAAAAPERTLSGDSGYTRAVRFSPDGRYLASGSAQGQIVLWDGESFERVVKLKGGTGQIRGISFSGNGRFLAGAAYAAPTIVWDLEQVRRTLREMDLDW